VRDRIQRDDRGADRPGPDRRAAGGRHPARPAVIERCQHPRLRRKGKREGIYQSFGGWFGDYVYDNQVLPRGAGRQPVREFRHTWTSAARASGTGFDVPSIGTVYLDKPMRNHTLMQTIARANRKAEGKTSGVIVDYRYLRRALLADPSYEMEIPKFVRRHPDLGSLWPTLKSVSDQWDPRRKEVRHQFEPLIAEAERMVLSANVVIGDHAEAEVVRRPGYDPSAWTGASSHVERVQAVKTLVPVAQNAVEQLLAMLDIPGHNGGPPLDEVEEAIGELRQLHAALGTLLGAADEGRLLEAFNGGLATETARYAKRAARALRDDPVPYAIAASVLAVLTACGLPGIGGFLSSVALQMKKK